MLGHVDPGSRSVALIIGAICDSLQSRAQPTPQRLLRLKATAK